MRGVKDAEFLNFELLSHSENLGIIVTTLGGVEVACVVELCGGQEATTINPLAILLNDQLKEYLAEFPRPEAQLIIGKLNPN